MTDLVAGPSLRAQSLSAEERARLAQALLASVQADGTDPQTEAAWSLEIERRLGEIESGRAPLIPAEEVFAEVRSLLR
jgi:putative addiction module component (TIGR02574 family)